MKNLMQQLSPESLEIIEREKAVYGITVQNVIDDLEKNHWPIHISFQSAIWLGYNVCGAFDALKIFQLFSGINDKEVGS